MIVLVLKEPAHGKGDDMGEREEGGSEEEEVIAGDGGDCRVEGRVVREVREEGVEGEVEVVPVVGGGKGGGHCEGVEDWGERDGR